MSNSARIKQNEMRNTIMKSIKNFVAAATLSLLSFGAFAQSITAVDSTLEGAEAQIARQAKEAGASYKITETFNSNHVHMTAELSK
jgi:hypothetical protein